PSSKSAVTSAAAPSRICAMVIASTSGRTLFTVAGRDRKSWRSSAFRFAGAGQNPSGSAFTAREPLGFPPNTSRSPRRGLFSFGDKREALKLFVRIRRLKNSAELADISARQWLDSNIARPRVREALAAIFRLATYCSDLGKLQAAAALNHVRIAMRGVIYID